MGHLSKKVLDVLKKIWPGNIKKQLKNDSLSYVGKKLNELNENELIIELSLRGHQCSFA